MLISCFHSVRVYGRELTVPEVAWNARVDAERFRGADRMIRAEVTGFCKVNGGFAVLVR